METGAAFVFRVSQPKCPFGGKADIAKKANGTYPLTSAVTLRLEKWRPPLAIVFRFLMCRPSKRVTI
jgi:hypothetical protein